MGLLLFLLTVSVPQWRWGWNPQPILWTRCGLHLLYHATTTHSEDPLCFTWPNDPNSRTTSPAFYSLNFFCLSNHCWVTKNNHKIVSGCFFSEKNLQELTILSNLDPSKSWVFFFLPITSSFISMNLSIKAEVIKLE